ncbi:hypothetical protein G7Y89_g15057 [Cudoniella acicularis]|uniref:FHA domain-containing protein n=1 Tax=Cudoniella acicularis TaxID=354080 RepID=A0A8H4QTV5_9HELO|nr:hypothetical protein G7Y89_g15057 [Cudoniella acicularis]
MWVLECDGDALKGKRLWLRPGKKFVFGRTKSDEGQFIISDKTISRKHLIVEVENVEPTDCAKPRSRSRVNLTDLETKIGTQVNGEQIRGKTHSLSLEDNVVILGKHSHNFHFKWVPVVFTFSFTSKEHKANPYTDLYALLGPLDIKVLIEYERGVTTHLVAKKRNTSKGLQALIDGKFIVHNDSFVNAVVAAATPDRNGIAPLEEDFDNFPNPLEYLPPKGGEPTNHEASDYAPNPARQDMFEGYTFIFYEQRQFDTLLAPITEGRGKALLKQAVPEETTVEDFVRYVKNVAGEKGLGEFEDGSEGKGVVVVRFNPVKGVGAEWFAQFSTQVSLYLDHRLIEQNEFLDAVLGNDASMLRRPLEIESSGVVAPPPSTAAAPLSQSFRSSQQASAPAATPSESIPIEPPRRRGRRTAAPRFKGFDDDDDVPMNLNPIPEAIAVDSTPAVESQSLFVSQTENVNMDREISQPPETQTQTRTSRKRRAPPIEEADEDVAPTAAALKRRRLEETAARRQRGESSPPPSEPPPTPAPAVKDEPASAKPTRKKKVREEIDLLEAAREQQEKAEALAKAERESLQAALEGMDISEIRNLAKVEEMEVKRTHAPPRAAARADESDRWDDKWNGRRNFKKFRRRGAENEGTIFGRARGPEKVIVPLEEVKKKDFGIGDHYWGEDHSDRESEKEREKESQRGKAGRKGKGKEKETLEDSHPIAKFTAKAKAKPGRLKKVKEIAASEMDEDEEDVFKLSSDSEDDEDMAPTPAQRQPSVASRRQTSVASRRQPPVVISSSSPPPAALAAEEEEEEEDEEPIVVSKPARASRSQTQSQRQTRLVEKPANMSRAKRSDPPVEKVTVKEPPKKKQKQLAISKPGRRGAGKGSESEGDSDEGLKFRFKR